MQTVKYAEWHHLIADEINVLLDLGDPLSEDGEQLWYSSAGIQKNLPALGLTGVKEGEFWRWWEGQKQQKYMLTVTYLSSL